MKIFLSSTAGDLRDAREYYRHNFPSAVPQIKLTTYEDDGHRYPGRKMQDACIELAKDCDAILILVDKEYGTAFEKDKNISITHAEIRQVINDEKILIPIVSKQTWQEYQIWKLNKGNKITFSHVRDPRLFLILEEVETFYCHLFDSFTNPEDFQKVVETIRQIGPSHPGGLINFITLPNTHTKPSEKPKLPTFEDGKILKSQDLNTLTMAITQKAHFNGIELAPTLTFTNGTVLRANDLNFLIDNIEKFFSNLGLGSPNFSFGRFKNGQPLKASQLNELVRAIDKIPG